MPKRVIGQRSFSINVLARKPVPALFDLHPEVAAALQQKKAVVALESTIISHGMPYPQNLETALAVEAIVREEGCVPATIAILDGRVKVGLTREDLEKLAKTGLKAKKTSRRDLALVVSQKKVGATTVSGTMVIAHKAGIKVFVTGGIGGVHRGGEDSMDVSADLTELGRTPVTVVCAGAKSILDIERTLEYLETQGVTVATYGDSAEFPAFYTPKSGFQTIANLESPADAASLIKANAALNLSSGVVIAVPIPVEDAPKDASKIEAAVVQAVKEANATGVRGKDITPFLLDHVKRVTGGESLKSNIALVKNNARIGSRIAASLAAQTSLSSGKPASSVSYSERPLIIGGTVLDISARFQGQNGPGGVPTFGTSHQGPCHLSMGGVGRNVAEACFRTGGNPHFLSAVGADVAGDGLLQEMLGEGMDVSGIKRLTGHPTAIYNAFLRTDGNLLAAVADMRIHSAIDGEETARFIRANKPPIVCVDGNLSTKTMQKILEACAEESIPVLFEPTSEIKAHNLFEVDAKVIGASVRYATPNEGELLVMAKRAQTLDNLLTIIPNIIEKRGPQGVIVHQRGTQKSIPPNETLIDCVSVTGAGDSMVGTLLTALAAHHIATPLKNPSAEQLATFARSGMRAASASLMTDHAVCQNLGPWVFDK
ncbi:Indigoidine synthase A like protein-domain-containing protein [Powellomyces hirtus]|nr:Indigoidine synthase A like protein-domain-containing protein [Powellomyces hirtus]